MSRLSQIKPGWFSLEGAAIYTGFSVSSIRAAMEENKFPVKRVTIRGTGIKNSSRIKREHLDAWIEGKSILETTPP